MLTIVAAACLLFVLLAISFGDRGTTLELRRPLMVTAMTVAGLLVGAPALWYWFRPREDLPKIPAWNLKHDSPGRWALKGVGSAVVLAGISCGLVYMLLNVLAQHVPGAVRTSAARLDGLQRGDSRDRCVLYADFSRNGAGTLRSCVVPRWGAPLLGEDVQTGTAVQLQIEENAIGLALVSVTPSGPTPTE